MPGCRIDGAFVTASMSAPGNICAACAPEISTTGWSPANEGMSCWSGDPDAGMTTCQNGACAGTGPVDCRPLTACHTASINPQTGQCVQSYADAGTPCGGQAMCHGEFYQPADTCDGNGFCIGGGSQAQSCSPYLCGQGACTTSCSADADCAAGAHCDDGLCFPDEDLGAPCDEDSDCRSGLCSDGVCCNQRCDGPCDICSAETGGHCRPVSCETCHACDEATGACEPVPNGTRCAEGACDDGVCTPVCLALGEPCESADQCCDGTTCAAYGDPLIDACCVSLGAPCTGEDDCCNNVRCASGICGGTGARCRGAGDGCASGVCCGDDRSAECCAVGDVCSVNQECVAACGDEGEPCCVEGACDDGLTCNLQGACAAVTCLDIFEVCDSADHCCEGLTCGGYASLTVNECCVPLGGTCDEDRQGCCLIRFPTGGSNAIYCGSSTCGGAGAHCYGDDRQCLSGVCCGEFPLGKCCANGEVCSSEGQCVAACGGEGEPCCVDGVCNDGLACQDGICLAEVCLSEGAECASSQECCGDLECASGFCSATCPGAGTACDTTAECCDGLRCWANGSLTDLECCVDMGNSCAADTDCCDFVFDSGTEHIAVTCGSGACGGAGAVCGDPATGFSPGCASGVCCGYRPGDTSGRCCGAGDVCDVNEQCVASCGADGETCCAGGVCDDGMPCVNGTCVALCAQMGDPCGSNADCCDNGAVPVSSPVFCGNGTCGGAGARCSGDDTVCDSGICCGSGPSSSCCGDGEACSIDQQCVPTCGGEGEVCCAGASCDDWLTCESGVCTATCAAPGASCATSDDCCDIPADGPIPGAVVSCAGGSGMCGGGGSTCSDPFGRDCASGSCCGYRPGETTSGRCCEPGTVCDTFEQCVASCGGEGENCCSGGFCDEGAGLACVGNTCASVCVVMGEPCDGTRACCNENGNPGGLPLFCGDQTCGGAGAQCGSPSMCDSGVCCGSFCCDNGEVCLAGACRTV